MATGPMWPPGLYSRVRRIILDETIDDRVCGWGLGGHHYRDAGPAHRCRRISPRADDDLRPAFATVDQSVRSGPEEPGARQKPHARVYAGAMPAVDVAHAI